MVNFLDKISDCGGIKNFLRSIFDYRYFFRTKKLIRENKKEHLPDTHAAIIIGLTNTYEKDIQTYTHGVDLLITYFNTNQNLFNIYECKTKTKAIEIIERKNVDRIWIFGHGRMGALCFGEDGELEYSDFKTLKEEQKKDFVGQFHCCSYGELDSSLAAYILKPNGKKFIKKGNRCSHQNRLAIDCCNKRNWDCNESCEH